MPTKTTKRKRAVAASEPAAGVPVAHAVAPVAAMPVAAGVPVVSLFSNSTVKDAAALKGTLAQVLEAPSVTIDAKSVERIDTAIIQVLCAFVRDRAERNLAVTWHGTPQTLLDAARLLGVGAMLALPSQAEA